MRTSQLLPLPKSFANLIFLILLGLLIIGPGISAETENPQDQNSKTHIEEDHDTKNLDKLLINYNKDQEKVLNDADKILKINESSDLSKKELDVGQSNDPNDQPVIQKADVSFFERSMTKKEPKSIKYADAMRVALMPLQKLSEKELVKLLNDNTLGSSAEVYIKRYPKIAVFAVRLIKDSQALPNLAHIVDEKDKLINFMSLIIVTILISFLLKRLMKREGRSIPQALGFWIIRYLIITSMRFAILLHFYSVELTPIFTIATKTLI